MLTFPRRYISSLTAVNVYLWLFQMFYTALYIQLSYGSAPQILLKDVFYSIKSYFYNIAIGWNLLIFYLSH